MAVDRGAVLHAVATVDMNHHRGGRGRNAKLPLFPGEYPQTSLIAVLVAEVEAVGLFLQECDPIAEGLDPHGLPIGEAHSTIVPWIAGVFQSFPR